MDSIVREALFNQVRSWMLDAGTLIKERIDDPFEIKTKSTANDLVTIVDQEVEMFFAKKIKKY